jgi:hypothetical protein
VARHSHHQTLDLTIYRTIKRFEKQENVDGKIHSGQNCVLRPKLVEKRTASHSRKWHRKLRQKMQVHHNTVKKYLTKMGVHRKGKKSAPKTTARQQSVIKAKLKLLTQNLIYKCVIYFAIENLNLTKVSSPTQWCSGYDYRLLAQRFRVRNPGKVWFFR